MGIQEDFYGTLAWLFILNINLPLQLFFFFHSSVCFADIWSMAYKPVEADVQHASHSHHHDYLHQHHAPANGHLLPAQTISKGIPTNGHLPSASKNKGVVNTGFYIGEVQKPQMDAITESNNEVFELPLDNVRL